MNDPTFHPQRLTDLVSLACDENCKKCIFFFFGHPFFYFCSGALLPNMRKFQNLYAACLHLRTGAYAEVCICMQKKFCIIICLCTSNFSPCERTEQGGRNFFKYYFHETSCSCILFSIKKNVRIHMPDILLYFLSKILLCFGLLM